MPIVGAESRNVAARYDEAGWSTIIMQSSVVVVVRYNVKRNVRKADKQR